MKKVKIISKCPSCDSVLERVKDQLFCRNSDCGGSQERKVVHYCKSRKIIGLGEKTIEKLGIETIEDVYSIQPELIIDIMGQKLGDKLISEIEKSKQVTVEKLLPAFSIYLIGTVASKKLYKVANTIEEITFETCKKAGLGTKATESLIKWIELSYPQFKELPFHFVSRATSTEPKSQNIKVCITGKLNDYSSREVASRFLESKGITVVSGVSKSLDYLITEDNKPSSKLSKANSYNIPVVTISHLIEDIINE